MRRLVLLVCAGFAGAGIAVADQVNSQLACDAGCPEGTRVAEFELTEFSQAEAEGGAFLYVTETCESFCEPIVPCVLPNVPVVDASGYRCQLLAGLSDFDSVESLDLSWGDLWDPVAAEHAP